MPACTPDMPIFFARPVPQLDLKVFQLPTGDLTTTYGLTVKDDKVNTWKQEETKIE